MPRNWTIGQITRISKPKLSDGRQFVRYIFSAYIHFLYPCLWHVVNILSKCQLSCSYSLRETVFEDIFTKNDWLTDSLKYKAVCRTAPATPGLLNMFVNIALSISFLYICNWNQKQKVVTWTPYFIRQKHIYLQYHSNMLLANHS